MTPRVIGLDLSLTGTGVAGDGWAETLTPPPAPARNAAWRRLTDLERAQVTVEYEHQRLAWIQRQLAAYTADLFVIEGPSRDSLGGKSHERAGLFWLVTHCLWRRDVPYAVVPPACLKLYATGKGGADKATVSAAVRDWFGWFDGDHNAADATVLMAMGSHALERPVARPTHPFWRNALSGCVWPVLDDLRAPAIVTVDLPEQDVA